MGQLRPILDAKLTSAASRELCSDLNMLNLGVDPPNTAIVGTKLSITEGAPHRLDATNSAGATEYMWPSHDPRKLEAFRRTCWIWNETTATDIR